MHITVLTSVKRAKIQSRFSFIPQRLYLLSQLKSQGMNVQALQTLFTGLIMSKITYALSSFAGQLTADDRNRIVARPISRKAERRGVSCTVYGFWYWWSNRSCRPKIVLSHQSLIPIPITVHTIYFHLEHIVPTASKKDNMAVSYLTLNTISTNPVVSIAASLISDDYCFLYIIYYTEAYTLPLQRQTNNKMYHSS